MNTALIPSYLAYFGSGLVLVALFMFIYERITPYRELHLMREGNVAAALSFGGAMLGFALTFVSSAMHAASVPQFVLWACIGGLTQILAYILAAVVIRRVKDHIINGNVAVGLGMFFTSVTVGALNAAALS